MSVDIYAQQMGISDDEISQEQVEERRAQLDQQGYLYSLVEADAPEMLFAEPVVSNIYYMHRSFPLDSENARGSDISTDGSLFYTVERDNLVVSALSLSEPREITSASYTSELDISSQMGSGAQESAAPHGIYLHKGDGQRMWIVNRTEVWEYSLSVPWDVSSAVQTGYLDISNEALRVHDIDFRPDGRVMYIDDRMLGAVFQFELSTPWDIETAELDMALDISDRQTAVRSHQLSPDGDRLFLVDTSREEILMYDLSAPYDLRSAVFSGSYDVSPYSGTPVQITFSSEFERFYITSAQDIRVHQYQFSLPPDEQLSSISLDRGRLQANGLDRSRIQVTARDEDGEPLDGFAVRLTSQGGSLQSDPPEAITDAGGVAEFEVSSSQPGEIVYGAEIEGVNIAGTVVIEYLGIDPVLSSLSSNLEKVVANNTQTARVTIIARDEDGERIEGIEMSLLSNSDNTTIQNVNNITNSNGMARFDVRNSEIETVRLRAVGMGVELEETVDIRFVGVDPVISEIFANKEKVQANGSDRSQISIIAMDEDGDILEGVEIALTGINGNPDITAIQQTTDSDGIALFEVSNNNAEEVTFSASGMGVEIDEEVTIRFVGIDASESTIASSHEKVVANEEAAGRITVTARDEDGDLLQGFSINLNASSNSVNISNINSTTNASGVARFDISNTEIETVTFSASGSETTIDDQVDVRFVGVDADESSITASHEKVLADGNSKAIIQVTARDEDGDTLEGVEITLEPVGGSSTVQEVQNVTNSDGVAAFDVRNEIAEVVNYRAAGMGVTLSDEVSVNFVTADPEESSVIASKHQVEANGEDQSTITVTIRDEDGDILEGVRVNLRSTKDDVDIESINENSDENGEAHFNVKSYSAGRASFIATAIRPGGDVEINEQTEIEFIPIAPVALSPTGVTTNSFRANWEAVSGASSYLLDVSSDSAFNSFLNGFEGREVGYSTNYEVVNLNPGNIYYYRVRAIADDLKGAFSSKIRVETYPEVPVASEATDLGLTRFTANWSPAEGAKKYYVDVSENTDFSTFINGYENFKVVDGHFAEISGLDPNKNYYYRVRSKAVTRISENSNTIELKTAKAGVEQSSVVSSQLRVLANGIQENEILVNLRDDQGRQLKQEEIKLRAENGSSEIRAVQNITDEKGDAKFAVSNTNAEKVTYRAYAANDIEIGSITVEFITSEGLLELGQNYPNPFSGNTVIPVTLPERMHIRVEIINVLGSIVQTVVNEEMDTGYYEIAVSLGNSASGTYFYRIIANDEVKTGKMIQVK